MFSLGLSFEYFALLYGSCLLFAETCYRLAFLIYSAKLENRTDSFFFFYELFIIVLIIMSIMIMIIILDNPCLFFSVYWG